jgi:hypothetical protein
MECCDLIPEPLVLHLKVEVLLCHLSVDGLNLCLEVFIRELFLVCNLLLHGGHKLINTVNDILAGLFW